MAIFEKPMKPIALHLTVFALPEDVPRDEAETIFRGLQEASRMAQLPGIDAVDVLQLTAAEFPSFLAELDDDVKKATHFALRKLGARGQDLIDHELDHQFVWTPVEISGAGCLYFLYVIRTGEGVLVGDFPCPLCIEGPRPRPGFRWN